MDFVGNIGGDDFIFIVPWEQTEPICKILIAIFSIIMFNPFGEEEKQEGTMSRWTGEGGAEDPLAGHVDLHYA